MVWVCLIFPVRNKLWLNRHPFADIIVCTKASCWLSCIAGAHTAEWQRIAVRPGLWLLLKIRLVPLLMQTLPFPVAAACWTVPEQDGEYVTSLQRDIASQQPEQSEEHGWVITPVTCVQECLRTIPQGYTTKQFQFQLFRGVSAQDAR